MKLLISCLLVSAFSLVAVPSVLSLLRGTAGTIWMIAQNRTQCYFCYVATQVQYCNEIKTCPANYTNCKTVELSPNFGFPYETSTLMVTRDCVQDCQNSDNEDLGSEYEVYCCEGDLCNNRYGVVSKATSHHGALTYHLQSGAYGGIIMVFSLFVVLFPSWVW